MKTLTAPVGATDFWTLRVLRRSTWTILARAATNRIRN